MKTATILSIKLTLLMVYSGLSIVAIVILFSNIAIQILLGGVFTILFVYKVILPKYILYKKSIRQNTIISIAYHKSIRPFLLFGISLVSFLLIGELTWILFNIAAGLAFIDELINISFI